MILSVAGIIIGVVAIVAVIAILFAMSYVKAGPDTAIMVSGAGKKKILIGRAGIRIPFLQRTDKLSLKAFQVDIKTEEAIPTKEFININVDGVANLKVSSDPELLAKAFESILNMDERELQNQLQQVLQGNMREIVGTVEIKELVRDRQGVANKVKENVVPDMAKLGIEVVNFNIQSFSDDNKVIENLGIDNISQISKDAAIARANAEKEAALAEAQGIEAKGKAEADAIRAKAEAMKQYGEAATLQLILDSNVLPNIVEAYAKPMSEAMSKIDSITMYGEGNTAKLTEEISKNGTQIFDGLQKATGLDIKSLLAGYFGGKLISKAKPDHKEDKEDK